MAQTRTLQRSFGGGEVTPEFFGRIDDVKFATGAAKMRNFIALPHGPVANRPGFAFVRAVKDSTKRTRLISFTFSNEQTFAIEMGAGYFRFHTQGATLLSGGVPYEVANPYAEADLFDIHYVQSADVLTLVHPNYAPRELRRLGATNWQLTTLSFASPIAAPGAPTVVASGHTSDKYTYRYVVTAVDADGRESVASAEGSDAGNLFETGGICTISWSSTGASRYNVYKYSGGLFGYIGQTATLSLVDDNITSDISKTPPIYEDPFLRSGAILSVPVSSGGSGYSSVYVGGQISAVNLPTIGGLTETPPIGTASATLTVSDSTGSGATFSVSVTKSLVIFGLPTYAVTGITVLTQGSGYSNPAFTLRDANGTVINANLTAVVSTITKTPLKLTVSDSTGTGAEVAANVSGGVITGVTIINAGVGYTSPTIVVSGSGSGAAFGSILISQAGDYPGAVSYFEQRRVFAGTAYKPQNIWMTKSGTESSMSYSLPVRDDDRIAFRVAAREANVIRHIVPLGSLVLLTGSAEWRVTSVNSDAITPSSISVRPQSYIGANNTQPVIVNNSLIYAAARGGHVREMGYNDQAGGYVTGDMSLRAPHLFDGLNIVDMAYRKAPQPVCWFVSSNGKLLGLTYVPEQEVGSWHQHDTDGAFESICVVAEGTEDVLYAVIRRTINGNSVRYVERMREQLFGDLQDAFFVDSGLSYYGQPADEISGLGHLEGKTVNILADGAVHPQRVVTGGKIALDAEASKVHIGLPIEADLQTLPLAMGIDNGYGQGRFKNVNKAWMRVHRSSGIFIGPNENELVEAKQRTTEAYGLPPALKSEEIQVLLTPTWADSGQVYIRQSDPLPLTIVSLTLEVSVGG
jgi:hypothetical protein